MQPHTSVWDRVRKPRGPLTRAVRGAGLSALGTYTAYLVHGLRHPALLRASVAPAEREEDLPGDDIVTKPHWVTNFATDIAASPSEVWPWIVQMGYGRAGWYTWFPLDNGGVPSAEAIVPDLQTVALGDIVPDGPRASEGFGIWRVRLVEPDRALVLHSRRNPVTGFEVPPGDVPNGSFIDCSWAFVLVPAGAGTRLRIRVRARLEGRLGVPAVARAARLLFGLGDNVMENSMLEGIRQRAERHASGRVSG